MDICIKYHVHVHVMCVSQHEHMQTAPRSRANCTSTSPTDEGSTDRTTVNRPTASHLPPSLPHLGVPSSTSSRRSTPLPGAALRLEQPPATQTSSPDHTTAGTLPSPPRAHTTRRAPPRASWGRLKPLAWLRLSPLRSPTGRCFWFCTEDT